MPTAPSSSKYVVIGAGLAGAATAWQLASRGHEVTILERSTPANDAGSSHGSARIFRYAYPDAFYTGLVQQARLGWDELTRLSGRQLITPTGSVDYGALRQPEVLARVLRAAGIEHDLLTADAARERWPQIAFDTPVLWHPGAGVIDAETAVTTMVELALGAGAQLRSDWPVAKVTETATGYRVHSDTGESVDAENVIVSAGGWLPSLLGELPLPSAFRAQIPVITVMQEQAYHFPYVDPDSAGRWPTFIHRMDGMQVYGLPGGRDASFRGQKIAEYNGGRPLASAADQDGILGAANRDRVVDYVARYLPGLDHTPYAETTCLFTNTPTEDFIIDRVDNITLLSPCSGHGAKFAPVIGQLAADLATGIGSVPQQFRVRP
ncbi:FAD-dependent oxidoreductase [Cryobacterium aureum]|uniref:FAD-dependent oxidoreductase n=1 Tax=Cryobacterium aureum TaxID=995037 RepID=UPI001F0C7BF7|nr:FAD-dependent oxidoreductase [Cryobacterium aureum]